MCGIAGLVRPAGGTVDQAVLDRFAAALAHRGPDGTGQWLDTNVGFAQTRLAIIDLATGDHPLHGPADTHLVANGEIYNYVELREELGDRGFRTGSDCEPPLFLYAEDGPAYANRLRGMYAIALHDRARGTVTLSRDRFGIKPVYLRQTDGGIAFASESHALVGAGETPEIVGQKRAELLQLQFTTGRQTILDGIERLLPGETVTIENGQVTGRDRIDALSEPGPAFHDEDEALAALDRALEDSVTVHQRSDVPYGLFLSGGIDSSAVLAMMRRLNDRPVRAFTAWFPETAARDEREHARRVATAAGAEMEEVEFTETDFWNLLPAVAAGLDDPVADYATLPTWKLAARARLDVKVVLSGEGGDELFAGYGRYRRALRPGWLGGRPMRAKGTFDGIGLLRPGVTDGWRDGIAATERQVAESRDLTPLARLQSVDCADWLPHDLLTKLDRCLMANAVEGRTPFLDPAIAAIAARLPDGMKLRKKTGKWLLRRWLDRELPEADPFAAKRGFTVPVGEWIAARGADLGPLVARQPGIGQIAPPEDVTRFFRTLKPEHGFAAWTLLFYALWHRRHVTGAEPAGDVFDTLAEAS
jgi:asparagine synthase (glutamine-hydrolysing)